MNLLKRYEKVLEFPLNRYLAFRTIPTLFRIQLLFYVLIIVSLMCFLIGLFIRQILLMNLINILLWGSFFIILEILRFRVQTIKNNMEFFGVFLAHEFKLLLETTQSMVIAVDYLIRSIPTPLKFTSKKFLNEQYVTGNPPEQSIIQLFKYFELPSLVGTFQKITNDWKNGSDQVINNQSKLENDIQNQIELYNKSFATWSSLISALSALLPLFAFFLLLMLGYQTHEYFLIITAYLIVISCCFYLIDPFSIKFIKQSGISDKSFSSGWSAALFTENLAKNLQKQANAELASKLTILSLIKEKKINLDQFHDFDKQFKRYSPNELKSFHNGLVNPSLYFTSFLMDLIDSKEFLKIFLPYAEFSRIRLILDFLLFNSNIDVNTTINHLFSLSSIQYSIENTLQQRIILIKSEYRKNILLLVLQSCVIGLLIGLEPFFSIIQSISLIKNSSDFYEVILKPSSIQSMFLVLLFCNFYLIAQILTLKAVYNSPKREALILLFIFLFACILTGYNIVNLILSNNFY